jgi:hypothetical protein
MITFQPVTLHNDHGEDQGMLAFSGNRLIAVLTHLDKWHGDLDGHWFVEARFGSRGDHLQISFETLLEAETVLTALYR